MKLSTPQRLMLNCLQNARMTLGVPIGLSDLSDPKFIELVNMEFVTVGWVDVGSIKADITEAGRVALAEAEGIPS